MTRLGWILLALFVAVGAGFALLIVPGGVAVRRPAAPVAGNGGGLLVPVAGVARGALTDSFSDARGGGVRVHGAEDIMAPAGTPVLAAASGTVEKLFDSVLGGRTIYVRSADRATVYYYAHLAGYAPGLAEGKAVAAGEVIGAVGSTGDADPGAPHLHFEVKRMRPGERWWQGTAVNPYPLLAGAAATR